MAVEIPDNYKNVDSLILNYLVRDFRICKPNLRLPEQFKDFVEWLDKNYEVLLVEEFGRSILSERNGISVRAMIRILMRFSNAGIDTQRKVLGNLICNDRYVHTSLKFKVSEKTKMELDLDNSYLYLEGNNWTKKIDVGCYL